MFTYFFIIFLLQESGKLARNRIIDSQRKLRHIRNLQPGLDQPPTCSHAPSVTTESLTEPRIDDTPRKKKLKKIIAKQSKTSLQSLKKLKALQQKCRRLKRKIASLENIISELKSKNLINNETAQILSSIGGENKYFLQRYIDKKKGHSLPREYCPELRKFAVTLNFLSPRAYTYIRQQIDSALPHPSTISKWYKTIDCMPGFTAESFETIKQKTKDGKKIYSALIIDSMAIRKIIEWDGTRYFGYVDIGNGLTGDDIPVAKEAIVFMLTSLNDNWKIPVGFFLVDGVTGNQLGTLVKQCITLLRECNVHLCFLTFDGLPANISMATNLGCVVDLVNLKTIFTYQESEVGIYPDPCHNVKLIRNTLAEMLMIDEDGNTISWDYIKALNKLQMREGFHAANKMRKQHVLYQKQTMKVRLATQLLSASVADSLDACREKNISGFENSAATARFIRLFNDLFDILNSRTMKAKGWKRPIANFNCGDVWVFFENAERYIRNLRFTDSTLVLKSRRKTGFLGFMICMRSIRHMYNLHVSPKSDFKYLTTYKISQDHLELFFGAIRAKGGFNNNPSVRQFISAYKRLLVHAQFKSDGKGNCISLSEINILTSSSCNRYISHINISTDRQKMNEDNIHITQGVEFEDHDYFYDPSRLTEFAETVIEYIAGFVVRKIKKMLYCQICVDSLEKYSPNNTLTMIKNKGGLLFASQDVIKVCKIVERILKQYLSIGVKQTGLPQYMLTIISKTLASCGDLFGDLSQHSIDQWNVDNHRNLLIKAIAEHYLKLRIHYMTKQLIQPEERVRNFLNKTVLFKGQ